MHPVCLARFLWRSVFRWELWSGHNFYRSRRRCPPNVIVLECATCSHVEVLWAWEPFGDAVPPFDERIELFEEWWSGSTTDPRGNVKPPE